MSLTKKARLLEKFRQQVSFIERSCQAFDSGLEDDAIRIATTFRTIFHKSRISKSLISQLKWDNKRILSSSRGYGNIQDYLSWVINIKSPIPVTTKPILGNQFHEVSISDWWENEPTFFFNKVRYPRKKIILTAANKDGGAHVDELEKFYEALGAGVEGFSIVGNLTYNSEPPFEQGVKHSAQNAHYALLRQFAHEFLASVRHFDWVGSKEK
jgi:hypothetical protein